MNHSTKMSHTVDVIPSQRKASLMDCIRHQAKGIAVDNNDTYCILSRKNDNHLEMKEMTFKRDGDVASLNDFSVAYPIVLLSDITADDKLTAKNTHEVMNRLYREHYQSLSDIISSHKNQVYELYKTVDEIDNKQKMIVSRISEALSLLEEKSSEYDTFSLLSDDDKKNYFRLQKNMIAHHDYLMKLLDTLSTLKLADEKLHKLSESAKHLSQMLDADYQRVGLRHDE
jgi:primosomal protein N''